MLAVGGLIALTVTAGHLPTEIKKSKIIYCIQSVFLLRLCLTIKGSFNPVETISWALLFGHYRKQLLK